MELIDAIYHRRAVREFTGEPVGRDVIEKLIDAAIQAPSAMNLQPGVSPWCRIARRCRASRRRPRRIF